MSVEYGVENSVLDIFVQKWRRVILNKIPCVANVIDKIREELPDGDRSFSSI